MVADTDPARTDGAAGTPSSGGGDAGLTPPDAALAGAESTPAASVSTDAESTALALVGVSDDLLDLGTSAELLAAAQQVAALSTQVAALSEAVAVELADAEAAATARAAEQEVKRAAAEQAALRAALSRMSTRIAATDAAPNGEIPLELLCRPRFANVLLRCDAAAALDQVNAAYRAAFGRDLAASGGYRTLAEQQQARAARGDLAAQPGTSNHGRGLAVDFSDFGEVGQFDDADYLWMVANAPQFGWVHPPVMGPGGSGPLEPWHWEFGGL
jgi:LAS superfamily LD-carboxypeptidase LdcB